jgi:hypothetical protein
MFSRLVAVISCIALVFLLFPGVRAQAVENQVSVTATVPAKPAHFQASLSLANSGQTFSQNTDLSYSLTYGSRLTFAAGLTIEANWSQGTIEGSSTPLVDTLEYGIGSASNAHNATPPVVDTVNRKITWTISTFPANTVDKTVTFRLKTTSAYTSSRKVSFTVSGRVLSQGTQTTDATMTKDYAYTAPTTTPTPAASPTPTPLPKPPSFQSVAIRSVASTEATIAVQTSTPTTLTLRYGTAPNKLENTTRVLTAQTLHQLLLAELSEDTQYYFAISATDASGMTATSDIFTFKTAKTSEAPKTEKTTVNIQSKEILLSNRMLRTTMGINEAVAVLPTDSAYSFSFAMKNPEAIKTIDVNLRNKFILGIHTVIEEVQAASEGTNVQEIAPGVYSATLKSPSVPGTYELFLRIHDYHGNITEEKIADIHASQPVTVREAGTESLIENARVFLFRYNERTGVYEPVLEQGLGIKNPSFSEPDGTVPAVLPLGRYRAEVNVLGYNQTSFDFDISPKSDYPTIHLEKTGFSLMNAIQYYFLIAVDSAHATRGYITNLSTSNRFFDLVAFLSLIILLAVTLLTFSLRTHIPLIRLPRYLVFHIRKLLPHTSVSMHMYGTVVDDATHSPVTQADVYIIDADKNVIADQTSTNKAGAFFSDKLGEAHYTVQVMKKGYEPSPALDYPLADGVPEQFTIGLHKSGKLEQSIRENVSWAVENVIGFFFELLLIASLVFEILFGYALGWQKVAPFLLVSLLNLLLWLVYLRHFFVSKS